MGLRGPCRGEGARRSHWSGRWDDGGGREKKSWIIARGMGEDAMRMDPNRSKPWHSAQS